MKMLLAVALGGAIGAVARYQSVGWFIRAFGTGFPWGTLFVNAFGSLLMGLLVGLAEQRFSFSPELRGLLIVGMLGAFTTFSSFALDVAVLQERGALWAVAVYIAGSVLLSVFGLMLGLWLTRLIAA